MSGADTGESNYDNSATLNGTFIRSSDVFGRTGTHTVNASHIGGAGAPSGDTFMNLPHVSIGGEKPGSRLASRSGTRSADMNKATKTTWNRSTTYADFYVDKGLDRITYSRLTRKEQLALSGERLGSGAMRVPTASFTEYVRSGYLSEKLTKKFNAVPST
jgi:hypothetical protein